MCPNHGDGIPTLHVWISRSTRQFLILTYMLLRTFHFLPTANAKTVEAFLVRKYFPPGLHIELQESRSCKETSTTTASTRSPLANVLRTSYPDLLEAGVDEPLLDRVYGVKSWWKSAEPKHVSPDSFPSYALEKH